MTGILTQKAFAIVLPLNSITGSKTTISDLNQNLPGPRYGPHSLLMVSFKVSRSSRPDHVVGIRTHVRRTPTDALNFSLQQYFPRSYSARSRILSACQTFAISKAMSSFQQSPNVAKSRQDRVVAQERIPPPSTGANHQMMPRELH